MSDFLWDTQEFVVWTSIAVTECLQGHRERDELRLWQERRAVMRGARMPWVTPAGQKSHRCQTHLLPSHSGGIVHKWRPGSKNVTGDDSSQQLRLVPLALPNIPKIISPFSVYIDMKITGLVKAGWETLT